METKDKQLLLKDLCARLPYGIKVCYVTLPDSMPKVWDLIGMPAPHLADIIVEGKYRYAACDIEENIKPYLRPMSSMTEEEKEEFDTFKFLANTGDKYLSYEMSRFVDWLNQHMFDYRGLILKGLALEAPEGMYNLA